MPVLTLPVVLKSLRDTYGAPAKPISTDPFHLILWEQVGYLVPDPIRTQAYRALQRQVGLTPARIASASSATLTAVARKGGSIAASARAGRMRLSAELVLGRFAGNLVAAIRGPLPEARRILAKFPMIGEPGADKILAISRGAPVLPLDSNALRVLERLGLSPGGKDYRRAYQAAQEAVQGHLPRTAAGRVAASSLLRQHGQTVCRRSKPVCPQCPLRSGCPTGRPVASGT